MCGRCAGEHKTTKHRTRAPPASPRAAAARACEPCGAARRRTRSRRQPQASRWSLVAARRARSTHSVAAGSQLVLRRASHTPCWRRAARHGGGGACGAAQRVRETKPGRTCGEHSFLLAAERPADRAAACQAFELLARHAARVGGSRAEEAAERRHGAAAALAGFAFAAATAAPPSMRPPSVRARALPPRLQPEAVPLRRCALRAVGGIAVSVSWRSCVLACAACSSRSRVPARVPAHSDGAGATASAAAASAAVALLASSAAGKPRLRWSPPLHARFLAAVAQLGGLDSATPKARAALCAVLSIRLLLMRCLALLCLCVLRRTC
jgi:SHAQKYF class myb-like DNA-binding protein